MQTQNFDSKILCFKFLLLVGVHIFLQDTLPPTATILSKQNYTNAEKITIDIKFSEACTGKGGFTCVNSSNCNVSSSCAQNLYFTINHASCQQNALYLRKSSYVQHEDYMNSDVYF